MRMSLYYMRVGGVFMTSKSMEKCDCSFIHSDTVRNVTENMPKDESLYDLAEFFKVFGDTTRIKILCALFQSEMCVCDIASVLEMKHSAISHQLRVLKSARLVKGRRDGKVVYYSLDDNHIKNIFDQGFEHVLERKR